MWTFTYAKNELFMQLLSTRVSACTFQDILIQREENFHFYNSTEKAWEAISNVNKQTNKTQTKTTNQPTKPKTQTWPIKRQTDCVSVHKKK